MAIVLGLMVVIAILSILFITGVFNNKQPPEGENLSESNDSSATATERTDKQPPNEESNHNMGDSNEDSPITGSTPDDTPKNNGEDNNQGSSIETGEQYNDPTPTCGESNEDPPIITSERRDGPTPNGGDYSEIFYFDDDGNSVDKTVATNVIVRECKNDGTLIKETFAYINQ